MRGIIFSGLALLAMSRVDVSSSITDSVLRFKEYIEKFNKTYASDAEKSRRFMAFLRNEEEIAELNELEGKTVFGWTIFSDLTKEEFKQRLNFVPYNKEKRSQIHGEIPAHKSEKKLNVSSLDWRTMNAVTPVKDQGNCGSCWAFSATQTVESAYLMMHNGTSADTFLLSEQEIVSCDKSDAGCNGGDLPSAFEYLMWSGLTTEAKYPYTSGDTGKTGTCMSFSPLAGTKPSDYKYATPGCYGRCNEQDEETLASTMVEVGPVGICVNAEKWQNYNDGVMSKRSCGAHRYSSLDHCVQLVGYESIDSDDGYWIVKNSWSSDWGVDGYIHLAYGTNTCGMADEAMYVVL